MMSGANGKQGYLLFFFNDLAAHGDPFEFELNVILYNMFEFFHVFNW